MAKKKTEEASATTSELTAALVQAIELTKPVAKKTPFNRKKNTPWATKDGTPKAKLRRKMFQHGVPINPEQITNEDILLLNKIKSGAYCDGHITVNKRKDRGLNIEYHVKTASQRLRLINQYGITSFTVLLTKLIEEAARPKPDETVDED